MLQTSLFYVVKSTVILKYLSIDDYSIMYLRIDRKDFYTHGQNTS